MANTFEVRNQIHALSLLDFDGEDIAPEAMVRNNPTTAYLASKLQGTQEDPTIRKHMMLLDGLALILIRDARTQVIATSWWITGLTCYFQYASNDNIASVEETSYINRLLNLAKDNTTDIKIILSLVIEYTKKKVISRGEKLAKFAGLKKEDLKPATKNLFGVNTASKEYLKIENRLRDEDLIGSSDTLYEIADTLLRDVAGAARSNSQQLTQMADLAFDLRERGFADINGIDKTLCDAFRKFADYGTLVVELTSEIRKMQSSGVNIKVEHIKADQSPQLLGVKGRLVDALNEWSWKNKQPEVRDFKQIKEAYERAQEGPLGPTTSIRSCQHAELTLAVKMIEQSQFDQKNIVKIGVSKSCCFWCTRWLDLLNLQLAARGTSYSVIVRASHGKRTDGWLLPKFREESTTQSVVLATIEKQFVARLNGDSQCANEAIVSGRRRADSRPLSDSERMSSAAKEVGWKSQKMGFKK